MCLDDLEALTFASHPLSEDKHLLMPLWAVRKWSGEPASCEGQVLACVSRRIGGGAVRRKVSHATGDYPMVPSFDAR